MSKTTQKKGLDLAKTNISAQSEMGHEFELSLPNNEPTGTFLSVRGDSSPTVKAHARRRFQEMQQRELVAKRRGKDPEPMSIQELEELAIQNAIDRLIGWREMYEDGKPLEFNEANARRVLTEHAWIRQAILDESATVGNFIKS